MYSSSKGVRGLSV